MSKDASAADDALPISDGEADRLFGPLGDLPALTLAVSGGPDSTALMVLAARWRAALANPPKLTALTVDHGLRPESAREARAVKQLARQLGIAHRTLRWSGRKPATGLQEAARLARYRLLCAAARKAGARCVLTAHTRDDQAETVLFRLARGSGVGGLAGMSPLARMPVGEGRGIMLIRPLLGIPKSRLVATLNAAKIPYADDPSNRDPRFARPRLRTLMQELAHEGLTAARLATLARRVQWVEEALHRVVSVAQQRITSMPRRDGESVAIDADAFFELPQEIAMRLLGRILAHVGDEGPVELGKLEALYEAMSESGPGRFRRTLAGALVTLADDRIAVERAPPRAAKRQNRLTKPRSGRRKRPKQR